MTATNNSRPREASENGDDDIDSLVPDFSPPTDEPPHDWVADFDPDGESDKPIEPITPKQARKVSEDTAWIREQAEKHAKNESAKAKRTQKPTRQYITLDKAGPARATQWLWPYWLPRRHLTMIAGKGGSGKGLFWCRLAANVTNYKKWPDGEATDPMRVLVFTLEDHLHETLKPRLMAAGADLSMVAVDTQGFDGATFVDEIEAQYADADPPLGLIVVDPIMAVMSADQDSNATTATRAVMMKFARLAETTGAAVLGVHHTGKWSQAKDGALVDMVLGSTTWVDAARMVWMMGRDKSDSDGSRVIVRAKSNLPGTWWEGAYRVHGAKTNIEDAAADGGLDEIETDAVTRYEFMPGEAEQLFRDAIDQASSSAVDRDELGMALVAYLTDQPNSEAISTGIVDHFNDYDERRVRRRLKSMIESGIFSRRPRKSGEFPDAGGRAYVVSIGRT